MTQETTGAGGWAVKNPNLSPYYMDKAREQARWGPASPQTLRDRARKERRVARVLSASAKAILLMAPLRALLWIVAPSLDDVLLTTWATAILCLFFASILGLESSKFFDHAEATEGPISRRQDGLCRESVELAQASPAARRYRDAALASGRELVLRDVELMRVLAFDEAGERSRRIDGESHKVWAALARGETLALPEPASPGLETGSGMGLPISIGDETAPARARRIAVRQSPAQD